MGNMVFVTLFRTDMETAISGAHKLLGTGGVFPAVADGLFGLYWSEPFDDHTRTHSMNNLGWQPH